MRFSFGATINEYYSKRGNIVDTNVEPVEPCVHVLYTLK